MKTLNSLQSFRLHEIPLTPHPPSIEILLAGVRKHFVLWSAEVKPICRSSNIKHWRLTDCMTRSDIQCYVYSPIVCLYIAPLTLEGNGEWMHTKRHIKHAQFNISVTCYRVLHTMGANIKHWRHQVSHHSTRINSKAAQIKFHKGTSVRPLHIFILIWTCVKNRGPHP